MKKIQILGTVLIAVLVITCATSGNSANNKAVLLDQAIQTAADNIIRNVRSGQKIAVLNFSSSSEQFSAYVIEELSNHLVNSKKYVIVDRRELDIIRREENFQMSGEVSDESMQAIGKKLGAQLVVSGSLTAMGEIYRIRTKVLNVESAVVEASSSADITSSENKVVILLRNTQTATQQPQIITEPSYYVSARGDDGNTGLSENMSLKTLNNAIKRAVDSDIKKITVIGTLDARSEGTKDDSNSVFYISPMYFTSTPDEIIITGKSGALGNERAVLSASGANKSVLEIHSGIFRFENVEISGARVNFNGANYGWGTGYGFNIGYTHLTASFSLTGGRQITPVITLGQGAIVRNNVNGVGIGKAPRTFIVSGGEIRDNGENGIQASGLLTIERGTISGNASSGINVSSDGKVTMTNGTITRNGYNGVFVKTGGSFVQIGGTISANGSSGTSNVNREEGTLGTNL